MNCNNGIDATLTFADRLPKSCTHAGPIGQRKHPRSAGERRTISTQPLGQLDHSERLVLGEMADRLACQIICGLRLDQGFDPAAHPVGVVTPAARWRILELCPAGAPYVRNGVKMCVVKLVVDELGRRLIHCSERITWP